MFLSDSRNVSTQGVWTGRPGNYPRRMQTFVKGDLWKDRPRSEGRQDTPRAGPLVGTSGMPVGRDRREGESVPSTVGGMTSLHHLNNPSRSTGTRVFSQETSVVSRRGLTEFTYLHQRYTRGTYLPGYTVPLPRTPVGLGNGGCPRCSGVTGVVLTGSPDKGSPPVPCASQGQG